MARRHRAEKRVLLPDPRYGSVLVTRLINTVMREGKKPKAEKIVYYAIERANEGRKEADPLEILEKAIDNVKPKLECKSRRVGGATYQVPVEVPPDRQVSLALRWIVGFAKRKKGLPMREALAQELKDAALGTGNAVRRRDEVHRMAHANRAFAHLRF
ncbi:30S ribosomal protein S7 [Candidatus Methylacidithermus pantelleriae]|uniref:Small ribosomal subunit protein uS7 n=1 Tax=Candidatus Methylacidithermus pantelleriae TaxID=2744239 RepID=A0A8J2FWE8_9BACT|nr:30S ribosomal protein S7 [Candidatus Methylacidithermus pantelleriae]CAF0698826.1 30S ribosomal subunit protein S7 [Candidatus Methylacidithermus pantelleriae]